MADPNSIASAIKEGLSLWKTFISTRQQAYERKKDKQQEKAIQIAEEAFDSVGNIFNWIYDNMKMESKQRKEYDRLKTKFYALKQKFNKYD